MRSTGVSICERSEARPTAAGRTASVVNMVEVNRNSSTRRKRQPHRPRPAGQRERHDDAPQHAHDIAAVDLRGFADLARNGVEDAFRIQMPIGSTKPC